MSDDEGDEPAADDASAADAPAEDGDDTAEDGDDAAAVDADTLSDRLDSAATALDDAETEADCDEVAAQLDDIEAALEAADLPEPDDDEDDPREDLEDRLGELRDQLEAVRGPYAEDVIETVETASDTLVDTHWTETGEEEAATAVASFVEPVADTLDTTLDSDVATIEAADEALGAAATAIDDAALDPDDDAETVATLVEAADELTTGLDDAEEWADLSVREQLRAEGFYDVLGHHKDFPPEWSALKEWEQRGRTDMIVLAYEQFDSEFMEEHCLEALRRLGDPEAYDAIAGLVDRREFDAIEIVGKMATDEPLETLIEYAGEESDPNLQLVSLKALGEIGNEEATQAVANQLTAADDRVRSRAARALGLLGDTRAIHPLADTLETDAVDEVRASAAWALNQIGTQRALDAVGDYADDDAYIVQTEAEKAA
jgi:hypothetical protein